MAKGINSACPLPSILLTSVPYVSDCPFNMISISKLTHDLNCLITFSDNSVTLQDRGTGKTIGIGREFQILFHLSSPSSSTVCASMDTPLLIHSHLGHPNISKFQIMVPRFSNLSSIECESCQLGKHTRVPFPRRLDQRTKSHFELVHTDVWGPSQIESTLWFQYFVTFIDDYSRCTWLFLMKNRVELFSIFQKFHAEVRTQFNTSIRILRSDNVKEYLFRSFSSFMSSHGILHQFSYAYTHQHNGVVECKNHHLVETTRTLLLYHKVLQRFWGDAILASCYLINHMSSSVFFQTNLSSAFPLISLVVFVLSIFLLLDKTSFQPKPRSVSSSVIPGFNEVIVATLLIHIDTLSLPMSHFLRTLLCSLQPTLPVLMSYLYSFFISSWIPHLYLWLLHLDHCKFILVARILTRASS